MYCCNVLSCASFCYSEEKNVAPQQNIVEKAKMDDEVSANLTDKSLMLPFAVFVAQGFHKISSVIR